MMRFVPLLLAVADGQVHRDSNMDSEAHIREYCAAGPSSLWQRYVCSRIGDADGWDRCWPQHRYSRCNQAVGVVAMFHGYSACPDAYSEMASVLQDECFHVYSFTTPGHGHPLVATDTRGRSIIGKYNLSGLPESRLDYLTFADSAISIMREEVSLTRWNNGGPEVVAAMGLSLGAPLATAVAVRSDVFSHLFNWSPFFGASASAADESTANIDNCLDSLGLSSSCVCEGIKDVWGLDKLDISAVDLCDSVVQYAHTTFPEAEGLRWDFDSLQLVLRSALEWVVESEADLPVKVKTLLDSPIGWGAGCEEAVAGANRGGFCQFSVRHLLAAHSFGQFVVRASSNAPRAMQVFMAPTQHDGPTRNGMAFQVMHALESTGSSVSACMWRAERGCDISTEDGNTCVVPHSSASTSDNILLAPHFLYWNHTERQGLASFLTGGKVTAPPEWNARKWDGSRNMCEALDATSPPSLLVTDLSRLEVTVIPTGGLMKRQIEDHVLQGVAKLSREDPKLLTLLHSVLSPQVTLSGLEVQRGNKMTVLLTLLEQGKKTFEAVLADLPQKSIQEALSFPVVDIRINGKSVVRSKKTSHGGEDAEWLV